MHCQLSASTEPEPARIRLPPVSVSRAMVPVGIVDQVLLVVVIGREKVLLRTNLELGNDLLALGIKVLLLHLLGHLLCNVKLVLVVCKDGRTVLCAAIITLLVELSWIVGAVEELDHLGVGHLGWVVYDLCSLSVTSSTSANLLV